ncbi:glycoside hydrolase family 76 protein [Occultella gossypii]|uniref:AGE family epimerase/isomerase n=1 Tax=Occultella gossypii TaxID=2800820 RepID=A0ABS7S906_9MICO|nr:glycoside hydrolase family 76 protein [Occultella gossypii]MBZ2196225.1 AGE family epimerase/isomerase [Occultella gossypii]
MTLKRTIGGTAAAVLVGSLALSAPAGAEPARQPHRVQVERAVASYEAMQEYLYADDGSNLYLERYPLGGEDRAYSFEWPFSQAHIATLDLTGIPGRLGNGFADDLADRAVGQERYWNADGGTTGLPGYDSYPRAPYGDGGDMFYDDNEWVALAKVQEYLATGDQAAFDRAVEIFDLVISGWDTDPSHAAPGGVFWTQAPWSTDRNTVSTMPGAQLGVRLYMITGEQHYLDWALRFVEWTDEHLLAPNGLYWDNIKLDGAIDERHFSYNQGVPIGTYALLYEATGDEQYLARAESIAVASYTYFVEEDRLNEHEIFFNSIYFKNLLLLESTTGGHRYRDAMEEYADHQWEQVRDPETGLFPVDGTTTALLDQAAMVQIYATLAWPRGQLEILY